MNAVGKGFQKLWTKQKENQGIVLDANKSL